MGLFRNVTAWMIECICTAMGQSGTKRRREFATYLGKIISLPGTGISEVFLWISLRKFLTFVKAKDQSVVKILVVTSNLKKKSEFLVFFLNFQYFPNFVRKEEGIRLLLFSTMLEGCKVNAGVLQMDHQCWEAFEKHLRALRSFWELWEAFDGSSILRSFWEALRSFWSF